MKYPFYLLLLCWILLPLSFTAAKTPESSIPTDSTKSIKLLFVGDIMGHTPQIKSAEVKKNSSYNYKPCFEYVAPIIRDADLAIGNLEVTLPGVPPYSGYPIFRSPDDLAKDLKWAGFDVLVTANNHSNDARKKGVIHTIETLKKTGFYQTGTFKNKKERALFYPLIINKNGFKLALLNYTYGTNDIPTTPPTIVNKISLSNIESDLKKAKKRQPDAIIVLLHWGAEYQLIENTKQQFLANWLAKQGVDLVIGSHPHVVQPIEKISHTIKGKPHHTLVAYSLGNFISNQKQSNTNGGIMLEVELVKSPTDTKSSIHQTRFIPIYRHILETDPNKIYQVLPISALERPKRMPIPINAEDKSAMLHFARVTRSRLRHKGAKERRIPWSAIIGQKKIAMRK